MNVDRLDRIAGDEADAVEILREPQEVAIVRDDCRCGVHCPCRSSWAGCRRCRTPSRRRRSRCVFADCGHGSVKRDGAEVISFLDHARGSKRTRSPSISAPAFLEQIAGLGQHEVHADLFEDAKRGQMDGFELVFGDESPSAGTAGFTLRRGNWGIATGRTACALRRRPASRGGAGRQSTTVSFMCPSFPQRGVDTPEARDRPPPAR